MAEVDGPAVIQALLAAHRRADWEEVRRLLHPEALIGVFATGGRPGDPEEGIRAMRKAHTETYYIAHVNEIERLGEDAYLLRGRVRYPHESGGFADVERAWVYVLRDRLLYRSAMFMDAPQARNAYALSDDLSVRLPGD